MTAIRFKPTTRTSCIISDASRVAAVQDDLISERGFDESIQVDAWAFGIPGDWRVRRAPQVDLGAAAGACSSGELTAPGAMVAHRARDGRLFYAPNNGWSTGALDVLAAAWVLAFVLVVAGRTRLAIVPAVMASTFGVIVFLANFGGTFKDALPSDILLAVQMTLLGVVPTLALVVASTRRPSTSGRRSVLWLSRWPP